MPRRSPPPKKTSKAKAPPKELALASSLSKGQRDFVTQYLVDFNATNALVRCGVPRLNAKASAKTMLNNPDVCAEVEARLAKLKPDEMASQNRIVAEYMMLAFGPTGLGFQKMAALGELARISGLRPGKDGGGKGKGKKHGVMVVPGMAALGDWENSAKAMQARLMEQVRE